MESEDRAQPRKTPRFLFTGLAVLVILALAVAMILPAFSKAKAYSGPGIGGNLRLIQKAKDDFVADGNTNEWPTTQDLFGLRYTNLEERLRPRYNEIYFINHTGAPPFAYIPKACSGFRGGEILALTQDGHWVVVSHR